MILFLALGLVARALLDFAPGVGVGLLAGLVVANLLPARGGCAAHVEEGDLRK